MSRDTLKLSRPKASCHSAISHQTSGAIEFITHSSPYFVGRRLTSSPSKTVFNVDKIFQLPKTDLNSMVRCKKNDNASILVAHTPVRANAIFKRCKMT